MADHRQVLSSTGLAFVALGAVAFVLGLVSSWLDVRQPIAYGMAIGAGLALCGLGLMVANRSRERGGTGGSKE